MNLRSSFACSLLLAVLALAATPAHANRDAVQFGSDIVVGPNESVHDAVCFFCSVDAKGPIDHDVVVFFGNVHVGVRSNHDVVTFFGNVHVDPDASIAHDVVDFFGNIRLGENASIGNDAVATPLADADGTAAEILFHEQVPFHARTRDVLPDAGDDLPVVNLVGIEEKRDAMR